MGGTKYLKMQIDFFLKMKKLCNYSYYLKNTMERGEKSGRSKMD